MPTAVERLTGRPDKLDADLAEATNDFGFQLVTNWLPIGNQYHKNQPESTEVKNQLE